MNIEFHDRQDVHNPHNGATVSCPEVLFAWLDQMRDRPAFFCELLGDNGYKLLVGVSTTLGCAQYSEKDGSPPYLMATDIPPAAHDGYMEFLTANTDTPVPLKFCLPMERIREVIHEFVRTGARSDKVEWEAI